MLGQFTGFWAMRPVDYIPVIVPPALTSMDGGNATGLSGTIPDMQSCAAVYFIRALYTICNTRSFYLKDKVLR